MVWAYVGVKVTWHEAVSTDRETDSTDRETDIFMPYLARQLHALPSSVVSTDKSARSFGHIMASRWLEAGPT